MMGAASDHCSLTSRVEDGEHHDHEEEDQKVSEYDDHSPFLIETKVGASLDVPVLALADAIRLASAALVE